MDHYLDFRTSHNIVLTYPLAGLFPRIVATTIDFLTCYVMYALLLTYIGFNDIFETILGVFFFTIYHLLCETIFMGQSLGKKLLRIRVVSLDGNIPTMRQYIIRWSFRLIDIGVSSGTIAMASIYSSQYDQRIGDLLAGTTVVKTKHYFQKSLDEIEKLKQHSFTEFNKNILLYSDEDMLVVKTILGRCRSFPTYENLALAKKLATQIKTQINDPKIYPSDIIFLDKILKEYIIQTR